MSTLQQGYLQYIPAGSDQAQKVFVNITPQEIAIYPEDPAKLGQSVAPISRFNLQKIQLVDSGDFQRPKSFGVLTERGNLIEFSCPTNSVRSAWIKSIGDFSAGSSNPQAATLKIPGTGGQPATMDIYRTPVNSYKIPHPSNGGNNPNRFSDFDGFANQALSQLNSLKTGGGPATNTGVPRPTPSAASFANPTRLNPAARVVKPSISRGAAPPPPQPNYSNPAPPTQPAPVLVAPQPAIRKTPAARSNNNVSSQQANKPQPKWLPGHYKATALVNNPKNPSPQRARNNYTQNQPQQASTLLGRSLSAPGYNANANHVSEPHQQQFYQSEPAGFPAQQTQYSQSHNHQQQSYNQQQVVQPQQGLPLEKMTLEQLRSAFMNMPEEIKTAITGNPASQPGSRKPSAHREREYNSDSDEYNGRREKERNQRNTRAESNNRRNREQDTYREPASDEEEQYRSKSRRESRERAEREREKERIDREKERERERSRSRQKAREYSSESNDSYEKRPQRRSSRSKYQTESNDEDYREDQGESDRRFSSSARALAYDEEEEDRFELPQKTNYERHSMPSRLDYTDHIEHDDEEYEEVAPLRARDLEYSDFQRRRPAAEEDDRLPRYMRSKEKEKTQPEKERTNRSNSNPKGTKTKPPLERSRSAPPPSSAARDFSSKSKSTVPRGDLLEWSKKQAWQKHVSTGFPMSKAQEKAKDIYKTMSQPSVKSKDPRDARLPVEASRSVPAEPAGRSSSQRMKALEDNMARSNLGAPNKPTPATPGSFFDFMKSRGAPVPAGLKNISQSRENVRNGGTSKENHRRESLAQQEDKLQTKNYKMTFPSPDQISAGLNHTEKQFPSSSRTPPQKNTTHQHQPQNTKQGAKKNSSPPEKQPKKNGDYISFDQMKRPQVSASNKLQQHRHSHDDASTISVSTQSVLRAERPQSQQNILQSNSSTPLTDVAEWQRVTNWLTSIRMERYIPTFREHGVTKLSLIELLTEEAFWELGIDPNDIPVIKQKVAEFSARIKSFSEEGALFTSITAAQRLQKGKPVAVDEDIDEGEEEEEVGLVLGAADPPLRRAASQREVVKAKKFIPISDIQAFQLDLFQAFDYGRYSSFIEMWERFLHYYLPSSTLTLTQPSEDVNFTQQRPALFYAKQAMEFHLFVYFYVYAIRKSLSKEEISVTRRALKEYLEGLAVQYETFHPLLEEKVFALGQPPHTNSIITTTTDNNYPHSSSAVIEESVGLPVSAVASSLNESQIEIGPESPPKPLITSREFATFAGLVFVPNPQYNPAFQTLFTDDWAQALRQRLTQFVAILIEEFEKMRAKDPLIALSEAPLIQSEKRILAPLKTIKEPLSLVRPSEIDQRRTFEDEIVQQNEKGVGNLLLQTAEISPIYPAGPSDRNELPLADRLASDQHQPRVHNLLPPTSTLLQQSEQYHSFERPVESPQSNCSTISQLTDDTPLKSDAHRNSARKSAQKPSSSAAIDPVVVPAPAFTFGKTSSSALADAANRANVRLKNLQSQSNGVTAPNPAPVIAVLGANPSNGNGSTLKPRISPSPPKSSLQMQVDNYNKLLKQNRLSKTSQPATSLLASSSMEIQQQTNNLLEEMHLPANKDLLNQIDAIIAPINQPVANSQINSNQPQTIPSNTRGFNLGVAVPRPVPVTSNPLPIPALDNSALADQVNRYKSLLKGSSKTASVSSNEERRGSSPSATREPEVGKEIPESLNSRTVEKPKDITKAFEPAEVAIINEQPVRAEDESLPESEESFPESEKEESFPPSIQEIAESAKFEVLDKDEAEKEEVVEEDITLKQVTETDVEGTNFTTERELHSDDGEVNEDNSELLEEDAIDKVNVEKEEEHQIAVIEKVEEVAVQEAEEEDHQIAVIEKVEEVAVQEAEEEDHQIAVIEKVEEVAVQETEEEDHQIAVIEEELHEVEEKKDEALVAPTDDNHEDKETTVESQLPLVNVTSHDDLKPSEQDLPLINAEEQRREEENLGEIKEAEAFPATDRVSSPSNFDQVTEPLLKSDEVIEEKVEITETVIEAEESFLVEEDAPDVEDTTNINTGSNPTTKSNKKKKKRRKSTVK